MYRSYVDLQMTQNALDAHMNMMKDQMRLASLPPVVVEMMQREGISAEYATAILKARGFIHSRDAV